MGQIHVEINRKIHSLLCAEGEEERLEAVARYVSSKADDLVERLGNVNDTQLLLMVSMLLADEVREYRNRWFKFDSEDRNDIRFAEVDEFDDESELDTLIRQ